MDFSQVDELKSKLKTYRPLNESEVKSLREDFIIENTYNSNAIEGNTLTLRETALILKDGITIAQKPIKDHLEAIGHKDAFLYMIEIANKKTTLSERIIKEIHSLILVNDAFNKGVYRRIPVTITGSIHKPPEPYLVPVQMEALISDYDNLKKSEHIISAIADFHMRLESIHPFIDGNGRTGRIILNLELIKAGYLPVNIKFTDRKRYYDCFDDYYFKNNSCLFTSLIVQYEIEEMLKYINILENIK